MQFLFRLTRKAYRRFPVFCWIDQFRAGLLRAELKSCGQSVDLMWPAVIENPHQVSIGNRVRIAPYFHVWGGGGVEIGSDVLIATHVAITSETHDPDASRFAESHLKSPVKIGDNVWIGAHAVILPGVSIGCGAVVGAGAVVRENVLPREIVAGVPAKVLRSKSK